MNPRLSSNIFAAITFAVCLWVGCQLSLRKPLWGDEIYTQTCTIERSSWTAILQGKIREGCNSPLYYLLQKAILSAEGYHLPYKWNTWSDGKIVDSTSQVLLRLTANGAMSLAIALIARYFFLRFSAMAAWLALLSCFSSYMVLVYWAEARPYALWFLLTTMQILLLLDYSCSKPGKSLKRMSVIHCVLGMTVIASAAQVIICSLWLWLNGIKKFHQHFLLTVLPLGFCLYYYYSAFLQGTLCHYKVVDPFELMHEAFAMDRLLLLLILGLIYLIFHHVGKFSGKFISQHGWILIFCCIGYLLSAVSIITYFKMIEIPGKVPGILNSRYLIFLSPVEIISITYFTIAVFRFLWNKHAGFWIVQFIVLVSFLYMIRILLVYQETLSRALFAY